MSTHLSDSRLQSMRDGFQVKFQAAFADAGPGALAPLTTSLTSTAESEVQGFIDDSLTISEWDGQRKAQSTKESTYRLTNKRYQGGTAINRDKIADDKLNLWGGVHVPMLGRAAAAFPDAQLADILLNNATCFDGGPMFDPSHPVTLVGGSTTTYSNSVALALDETNLITVRAMMRKFTDPTGKYRDVGQRFAIVCGPDLEIPARKLVNAALVPSSGGTNVLQGLADVIVVPQLSSNANRWFYAAIGLPIKPLVRQVREGVSYIIRDASPADCVDNRNENEYGVTFREAYGVSLPWLMIASDPDGAMT